MVTGAQLRAARELAGVRASDVAAVWDVDPAILSRLEQQTVVDQATVRRYRRAVGTLAKQRRAARRELIRELTAR